MSAPEFKVYRVTLRGLVDAESASAVAQAWIDESDDIFGNTLHLWSIDEVPEDDVPVYLEPDHARTYLEAAADEA